MRLALPKLRRNNPALIRATIASATSTPTRIPLSRCVRVPPIPLRPPSFNVWLKFARMESSAGISPAATVTTRTISSVNPRVERLRPPLRSKGKSTLGNSWFRDLSIHTTRRTLSAAPPATSKNVSVSHCRMIRLRPAPKASLRANSF
jgi:hypothetical protein